MEFRHTGVVKTVEQPDAQAGAGAGGPSRDDARDDIADTRSAVVQLLLEDGPITATAIGTKLGLTAAGVRRHLDVLIEAGQATTRMVPNRKPGRGRPAKVYLLTAAGRGRLRHAYDDLAGAAMRQLRKLGGEAAVQEFAKERVTTIVDGVDPVSEQTPEALVEKAGEIATAFREAGFAASTRKVGAGVQICRHHCPVSHVAEEFPELCQAELTAFRELLGTHVQQLATIANGDCACTTHVPLFVPRVPAAAANYSAENTEGEQ
ncbi:MAG: transcriptional regulator [Mycobacteriaceae bacterium]|nr:transcriptional regulator [Mycobacteriaceae bacterium]